MRKPNETYRELASTTLESVPQGKSSWSLLQLSRKLNTLPEDVHILGPGVETQDTRYGCIVGRELLTSEGSWDRITTDGVRLETREKWPTLRLPF